jgi:uncharacterized protein (TIGR00375 family)
MRLIADLHIHSRYSRATSARLTPAYLERWARIKGIDRLGTGDCTHPQWLVELREQLDEREEGLYTLKDGVRADFDAGPAMTEGLPRPGRDGVPRFVLTGEISTIYKRGERTRKVHHLVILPDFRAAAAFQAGLERVGNIASDGRPILGIDSRELLALLLDVDERSLLIPAHIWTPWFSVLGAQSGFNSIEECYGDLTPFIPAVETGLSSNPPMNWALSSLDRFSIISNSDAHSPDKLGREGTVFDMDLSYPSLGKALKFGGGTEVEDAGRVRLLETIEFFPQEGKYHYDGHRKCAAFAGPEAVALICPVCGKPFTRGVMGRVLELADRPVDETAPCPAKYEGTNRRPYRSLIPLREILGELLGTGAGSKKVDAVYGSLIEKAGSELALLMDMGAGEIEGLKGLRLSGELLAAAIGRMRAGEVSISPGYDGEYGVIRVFPAGEAPADGAGTELFGDLVAAGPAGKPKPAERPRKGAVETEGRRLAGDGAPGDRAGTLSAAFVPDPAQEQVVNHNGRRAIVIAGPGTGKTATLAARIARLLREGADPASILALSFTVKAAAELRERIARLAGAGEPGTAGGINSGGITAATFHSLCAAILREQGTAAGIPENFIILGESDRDLLLRELCVAGDRAGMADGTGKGRVRHRRLGTYIEARKRFLLLPGERTPNLKGSPSLLAEELGIPPADPEMERLYGQYRSRLRDSGLLDFDDLVAGTARLLAAGEDILRQYRSRFRFVFVDEYQDINFAQYALIRLLAPAGDTAPETVLWVIGDPNQAIYGFRGSDKRFIDRFCRDYADARRFELSRSFRCAAPIIKAAGQLTGSCLEGDEKPVSLFRSEYPTEKSEAEGIARRISRLLGGTSFFAIDSKAAGDRSDGDRSAADPANAGADHAGTASPEDCAVLIRAAALAGPIVKALKDHGIPFDLTGDRPWWEEDPANSLLEFLRDRRLSGNTVRGSVPGPAPAEEIKAAWESFVRDKAGSRYRGKKIPESVERLIGIAGLFGDISVFLDTLAYSDAGGLPEIRRQGVRVMTIHASKGLEFAHVFVAGLEEGLLPFTLYDGPETPAEESAVLEDRIAEERRLLYVAMTRARNGLYLSWARSRNFRGRNLAGLPSRFLGELEKSIPPAPDDRPVKRDAQMRLF